MSGRDDHGLLAVHAVDLLEDPDAPATAGSVDDGTLVAVFGDRDSWLHVRTLVGPPVSGWVNDVHLRGVVHVLRADGCPARAAERPGGRERLPIGANEQAELRRVTLGNRPYVRIRTLRGRVSGWVGLGDVHELPQPSRRCRR